MRRKNTDVNEAFSKLLLECQMFGLKKKDIAKAINKSPNTVTSYFLDGVIPSQETQEAIRQYLTSVKSTFRFQHIEHDLFRDLLNEFYYLLGSQEEAAKILDLSQSYFSKLLYNYSQTNGGYELSTIEQNNIAETILSRMNSIEAFDNQHFQRLKKITDRLSSYQSEEWYNRVVAGSDSVERENTDYFESIHNIAFLTLPKYIQDIAFDHIYAFDFLCFTFYDYDNETDVCNMYDFRPDGLIKYYRSLDTNRKNHVIAGLEESAKEILRIRFACDDNSKMIADMYHMERLTYNNSALRDYYDENEDFYKYLFSLYRHETGEDYKGFIHEYHERKKRAEILINSRMTYDEQILAEERLMYDEKWSSEKIRFIIERLSFGSDEWHLLLLYTLCFDNHINTNHIIEPKMVQNYTG